MTVDFDYEDTGSSGHSELHGMLHGIFMELPGLAVFALSSSSYPYFT